MRLPCRWEHLETAKCVLRSPAGSRLPNRDRRGRMWSIRSRLRHPRRNSSCRRAPQRASPVLQESATAISSTHCSSEKRPRSVQKPQRSRLNPSTCNCDRQQAAARAGFRRSNFRIRRSQRNFSQWDRDVEIRAPCATGSRGRASDLDLPRKSHRS